MVPENKQTVSMTVESWCPQKWAFIDMETGDIWVWKQRARKHNHFFRASTSDLLSVSHAVSLSWRRKE